MVTDSLVKPTQFSQSLELRLTPSGNWQLPQDNMLNTARSLQHTCITVLYWNPLIALIWYSRRIWCKLIRFSGDARQTNHLFQHRPIIGPNYNPALQVSTHCIRLASPCRSKIDVRTTFYGRHSPSSYSFLYARFMTPEGRKITCNIK